MQEIDLLPSSYHLNRHRRQKTYWRSSLAVLFVAIVVTAAVQQMRSESSLQSRLDQLTANADRLTANLQDEDHLEQEISHLDFQANLLARLRVQIPSSRILSAVTASRPQYVRLTQFQMAKEPLPSRKPADAASKSNPPIKGDGEEQLPPPAQRDLDALREQRSQSAFFVTLTGMAPGELRISQYMGALKRSGVFDEVYLQYIDEQLLYGHRLRGFGMRLRVARPLSDSSSADSTAADSTAVDSTAADSPATESPTAVPPATVPPSTETADQQTPRGIRS